MTAEAIETTLDQCLDEWEISKDQIVSVVTDGGANFVAAAVSYDHIHCVAHRLNLVVKKAFSDCVELNSVLSKVRLTVSLFRQSNVLMHELTAAREQSGQSILKLIQDVETRWNSTYLMIDRYLELQLEVTHTLINSQRRDMVLSSEEIYLLGEIKLLLKPFYEMTVDISGEKYITISRIIPLLSSVNILLIKTRVRPGSLAKRFRDRLISNFNSRFSSTESNSLFAFATILDPRFKGIDFTSNSTYAAKVDELSEMLGVVELTQQPQSQNFSTGIWEIHDKKVDSYSVSSAGMHSGLKHYLALNCLPRSDDPLAFWCNNKEMYHHLHNLALKYLTIQATSVPSERLFSKTGAIITDRRNHIKPKNVNKLCFLSSLPSFD